MGVQGRTDLCCGRMALDNDVEPGDTAFFFYAGTVSRAAG